MFAGQPQRVHMAAPTAKAGLTKGRLVRNSNKHKRLFDPAEPNGVKVNFARLEVCTEAKRSQKSLPLQSAILPHMILFSLRKVFRIKLSYSSSKMAYVLNLEPWLMQHD